MKYFFDFGAHQGEAVRLFREKYDPGCEFKIISYEPNVNVETKMFENHILEHRAVWINNDQINLYPGKYSDGTTCMLGVKKVKYKHPVKVSAINIIDILATISNDDFVIMKFNIEGGEYKVIPHILENGDPEKIDILMVQWHVTCVESISQEYHDELVRKCEKQFKVFIDLKKGAYIEDKGASGRFGDLAEHIRG